MEDAEDLADSLNRVEIDQPASEIRSARGDRMTDMAIYDYPAPGNHPIRRTAHGLKVGDPDAIAVAAIAMAQWLPRGAVLVPMPSRTGSPGSTRRLAERIAEIAGATVVDALIGRRRASNYERKRVGQEPLRGAALGMRQAKPLPDGPMWIVDNVIDTGATMTAAKAALNRPSSALAYAKVVRSSEEQTAFIEGCAQGPAPLMGHRLGCVSIGGVDLCLNLDRQRSMADEYCSDLQ